MSNLVSNTIISRAECLCNENKKILLKVKNHTREINSLHGSKIQ
jgi:hypothetical protein